MSVHRSAPHISNHHPSSAIHHPSSCSSRRAAPNYVRGRVYARVGCVRAYYALPSVICWYCSAALSAASSANVFPDSSSLSAASSCSFPSFGSTVSPYYNEQKLEGEEQSAEGIRRREESGEQRAMRCSPSSMEVRVRVGEGGSVCIVSI